MRLDLEGVQYWYTASQSESNHGILSHQTQLEFKGTMHVHLPFRKYEMQRLPMGLCNSLDIFQEKMLELFDGLDFVQTYIDDLATMSHKRIL